MGTRVTLADPDRASLLALLLARLLETRRGSLSLDAPVRITAAGMSVVLAPATGEAGGVEVRDDASGVVAASVGSDLGTLLDLALGRFPLGAIASGKLRLGGNPLRLLGLVRVLREGR